MITRYDLGALHAKHAKSKLAEETASSRLAGNGVMPVAIGLRRG
jgi:hypothetical protein